MHIALMATGAIGGYLGTRLAAGGHEVSAIARGAHLDAILKDGLQLESPLGDDILRPKLATADPSEIGPVDVIIFAVKMWDTDEVARACAPLMKSDTIIIPFQNGVETISQLQAIHPAEQVMGGVAYISATITTPGHIRQNGEFANFLIGAPDGNHPDMLKTFADACQKAGVNAMINDDIEAQLWKKLVFFSAISGFTAAARTTLGAIRDDPAMYEPFVAAMREAAAVAKARNIKLDDDVVETLLEQIKTMPAPTRATMANDLNAGNKLEAPWLSGAVSRLGRDAGVATPVNDTLYAAVRPFVDGAP